MNSLEEQKYQCTECLYVTNKKSTLAFHRRRHTGDKPFRCDQCSYTGARKDYLSFHKRRHTGEKPFQCNECSYAFAIKVDLLKHERTHSEEKPFQCDQCSFKCARKDNLRNHQKRHTSFRRKQCSFESEYSSHVTRHERTHMGNKTIQCDECDYASVVKRNFIRDISRNSGENSFECSKCGYRARHSKKLVVRHPRETKTNEWSSYSVIFDTEAHLSINGLPGNQKGASTSHHREMELKPCSVPLRHLTNEQINVLTDKRHSFNTVKDEVPEPEESDAEPNGYLKADMSSIKKETVWDFTEPVPISSFANLEKRECCPIEDGLDEWDTPIKTVIGTEADYT